VKLNERSDTNGSERIDFTGEKISEIIGGYYL